MTDEIIAYKGEIMLAGWAETHTAGKTVTFWLPEDTDEHPFKKFTVRKGKTAGHRFMAALVELNDDETPVVQKEEIGPLCKLAVQWCKDPLFWKWSHEKFLWHIYLEDVNEKETKELICEICNITSRKELDTNPEAKRLFEEKIRRPYMAWMEPRK